MSKLNITNIIAKRESLSLPDAENNATSTWDYLTLYNQDDEIIARSKRYHPEGDIELYYEGLLFVSMAGHSNPDTYIFIQFNSLKQFIGL